MLASFQLVAFEQDVFYLANYPDIVAALFHNILKQLLHVHTQQ